MNRVRAAARRGAANSCTASPTAVSVHKQSLSFWELYSLFFSSDYEKYGNAWPVNVTNRKQTRLAAVNNYKQWMECSSAAALRNVHHCPLSSEQIGGEKTIQAGIIRALEVFSGGHTLHSFELAPSWHLWKRQNTPIFYTVQFRYESKYHVTKVWATLR